MRTLVLIVALSLVGAGCVGDGGTGTTATDTSPTTTAASTTGTPAATAATSLPETTSTASTTQTATTTTSTTQTATTTTSTTTTTEAPDTAPPELTVTSPESNAVVTDRARRFAGTTEPGASLMAAGRYPVEVATDGSWSIVLMLNPGGNVATFVATDRAGNIREVRVPVFLHACADAPQIAMAAGATDATSLTGDLDGDARADVVTVYRVDDRWRVHLALAYGWETETDITPQVTGTGSPAAARLVDVGLPAVVVMLGGNLVGASYGFVAVSGCSLEPVVGPAGEMPDIWNGGGAAHSDYFVCESRAVTQVVLGHGETVHTVTETHHPFLAGSATFGVPMVSVTEIPFDPGEETMAWDELVSRRDAACVP